MIYISSSYLLEISKFPRMNIHDISNNKLKSSDKIKNRKNSSRQMFGKIYALLFTRITTDFNFKNMVAILKTTTL